MPTSTQRNKALCLRSEIAVVGSLAVTGTALAALILGGQLLMNSPDSDKESSSLEDESKPLVEPRGVILPLPPTLRPVTAAPTTSTAPSSSPPSLNPTKGPSVAPSISPTTTDPTLSPTLSPTKSYEPSKYPTVRPSKLPSSKPTNRPTSLGTFRLRLHWQTGYMWQELPDESWFCMACAWCDDNLFDEHCDIKTYCQENMSLALVNCDPKKGRNKKKKGSWMAEFNLLDFETHLFGMNGVQLQIHDTNLCVERMGSRSISLQQCNTFVESQRWLGFGATEQRTAGGGTEIKPSSGVFMKRGIEYESCLSQHHHPRQGERVYVQPCHKARSSDTNLWSVY